MSWCPWWSWWFAVSCSSLCLRGWRFSMHSRLLSRRDLEFVLYELLDVAALTSRPRFAEHSRETFDAALETAARIAEDKFAPHNRKSDLNEPRIRDGRVDLIPEVKVALDALRDAGFLAATQDYGSGGMQLPVVVAQACMAWF